MGFSSSLIQHFSIVSHYYNFTRFNESLYNTVIQNIYFWQVKMLISLFVIATVPKYYKLAKCYCYYYYCCYAFGKSIKIIIRLWQLYTDTHTY